MKIGAVEMGGTKMVLAVGDENGNISDRLTIPTTSPEETTGRMVDYFLDKKIEALGIASFGPINLNKESEGYGSLLRTPKPGWDNVNVVKKFSDALNVPIGFDTDVNGSCLGEVKYGAGKGLDPVVYITIGTGIGAGVYINGSLLHGLMHPETGHMFIRRHEDDKAENICPFHGDCFEGYASGPAIEKRWGKTGDKLLDNQKVWEMESWYISEALVNVVMCYSPKKIILGGGVMQNKDLYPMIRKSLKEKLAGYIPMKEILDDIDNYVVEPGLGNNSGIVGALELGRNAIGKRI